MFQISEYYFKKINKKLLASYTKYFQSFYPKESSSRSQPSEIVDVHPKIPELYLEVYASGKILLNNIYSNLPIDIERPPKLVKTKLCSKGVYIACSDNLYKVDLNTKQVVRHIDPKELNSANSIKCLDVCPFDIITIYGDKKGHIGVLDQRCDKAVLPIKTYGLHENAVNTISINPRVPNIFATSSNDQTTKIWDLRMLESRILNEKEYCFTQKSVKRRKKDINLNRNHTPICSFKHYDSIKSAVFHPSHGSLLLVTDASREIMVMESFSQTIWDLKTRIKHPHQNTNKLPIKASWHPHYDAFIVATNNVPAYVPDLLPDQNRFLLSGISGAIFDAHNGYLLNTLPTNSKQSIHTFKFNCTGDHIISSAGQEKIWELKREHDGEDT